MYTTMEWKLNRLRDLQVELDRKQATFNLEAEALDRQIWDLLQKRLDKEETRELYSSFMQVEFKSEDIQSARLRFVDLAIRAVNQNDLKGRV